MAKVTLVCEWKEEGGKMFTEELSVYVEFKTKQNIDDAINEVFRKFNAGLREGEKKRFLHTYKKKTYGKN